MHLSRLAFFAVLAAAVVLFPNRVQAQETLLGDAFHPQISRNNPDLNRKGLRTTAAAPFPFFDDFSADSLELDTNKWVARPSVDNRLPTISIQRGRNAPSKGVLSFDGATYKKRKHSALLETNYQDELVSQSFDLSSFSPADDLYLSFFYQRGGWGDAPEVGDSLILSFDTTGSGDYMTVWAMDGTGAAESTYDLVMVPLSNGDFFHTDFNFRFESYGSLNGELDVWHIDYVYFAANRGPEDTLFTDMSAVKMTGSPLGEFTAVPRDHYQTGGFVGDPEVEVSNVSGPQLGTPVVMNLTDPVGGNALGGATSRTVSSGFLNPYDNTPVTALAFSDQAANMNQYGTLRVTTTTNAAGDTRTENNVLTTDFRVDTVLAFDDGQPDAGYGLTTARSFCMEFRIPEPDTISGVWIAFTPTLHYNSVINQSTCMDQATFKLTLWDTLFPDSFRTQQGTGMVIQYDSADNYFQRFTFINPQVVDTLFYLGIRQNTDRPLGVGFDKQGPPGKLFFESGNATFVNSSQTGSIMMRPEFANIPDGAVNVPQAQVRSGLPGKLYPNPWQGGELWLEFEEAEIKKGKWRLYDLQGRLAGQGPLDSGLRRSALAVSENLGDGMYLLEVEGEGLRGEQIALRKRLLIQR